MRNFEGGRLVAETQIYMMWWTSRAVHNGRLTRPSSFFDTHFVSLQLIWLGSWM